MELLRLILRNSHPLVHQVTPVDTCARCVDRSACRDDSQAEVIMSLEHFSVFPSHCPALIRLAMRRGS